MLADRFAGLGVVLQWSVSFLLALLCYRLGQIGTHRRVLGIWAVAWAAQLVSLTGLALNAVAILTGRPIPGSQSFGWLGDACYLPGTMVFLTLIGIGVAQAVGRRLPAAGERLAILTSIAAGLLALVLRDRMFTGVLLVATTTVVVIGALIGVTLSQRRLRGRRLLVPGAIVLLGAVSVTYQLMQYFGAALDPLGAFANSVLNLSGYSGALASAVLGAAVIIMITEDGVRARRYAQQERLRALAEVTAPVTATPAGAGSAAPDERQLPAASFQAPPPRSEPAAAVADTGVRGAAVAGGAAPLRAPLFYPRTATLPQPVRDPDGSVSTAMVIDEAAPVRATLARIFQRGGWAVREAATGAEALNWLVGVDPQEAPTVIVCNFNLPGLGGRQFHAHLQQHRPEFLQRLIFVIDGPDEATADFIRATQCQLIRKPGTVEDVARAVEQVTLRT